MGRDGTSPPSHLLIVNFQHAEKDLCGGEYGKVRPSQQIRDTGGQWEATRQHCTLHLTLSALQVVSDGLKKTLTQLGDQALVGPVAHHGVALPRARLSVGQECGVVTLHTAFFRKPAH